MADQSTDSGPGGNPDDRQSIDDLESRLKTAQAREATVSGRNRPMRGVGPGMAMGMRVGVELIAGIAVGTLIGLALDRWLGTAPWLMVVFLLLGAVAGIMNAYRAVKNMDSSIGFGAAQRRQMKAKDEDKDGV